MLQITKGPTLQEAQIPFAWVEVRYPDKNRWDEAGFYAMVDEHLAALCERYRDYVRADVFGQNPYFRFFRKFKKTFPVMMQFESVLLKGREFPKSNAVTAQCRSCWPNTRGSSHPTRRSRARRSDGKTAAGVRIRAGACIFYQTVNRFCFFCEF